MPGERFLIVNADDFNLTPAVSRGVIAAHAEGIVSSTTVLVNLPGLEETVPLLAAAPSLGLGLHVNLTLGAPLSPAEEIPSLVDESGRFPRDPSGQAARARPEEASREIAAQRERFERAFGRAPTHLDSHHHVHRHEPLEGVFLDLCRRWKLPVRSPDRALREKARSLRVPTPDRFTGDVGTSPYWSEESLCAALQSLPPGVTELMCHPGYWDHHGTVKSSYNVQREGELRALCSSRLRPLLKSLGIVLITFKPLGAATPGPATEGRL